MDGNLLINNIRMLCKKRKVSISKLEADLFLSPGLISRWNKSIPAMDKVMDIADYFGISIDELVGRGRENPKHTDIGRLLILLYNRSLTSEINWEVLDFQNLPLELENTAPAFFAKNKSCDCYFSGYMDGFFFFTVTHSPTNNLQFALYILPDIYSEPQCICSDTGLLTRLYEFLNRRFSKKLNEIKTAHLIHAFINESTTADDPVNQKITPISASEASNF